MPKKAPEARIYGREFQARIPGPTPANPKTRPYILGLPQPTENKLYDAAFHERRK
jgi:hypothetical protein